MVVTRVLTLFIQSLIYLLCIFSMYNIDFPWEEAIKARIQGHCCS